ncbi:MAG: ankyrin repeat domain-containing protein [Rhodanobacteraceae bacterium]|nr:ankyrin repeat domain-containing protein [Rhodanobacteraceae bacterium]
MGDAARAKAGEELLLAVSSPDRNFNAVSSLIPRCTKDELNQALAKAAENGHLAAVRALIPVSEPKADGSAALRRAARNGHLEIVRVLVPHSDPKAKGSDALRWAATNGHVEVVHALAAVSDPKANDSEALYWAARNGHLEIVLALVPLSDPKANGSDALRWAAANGCLGVVRVLVRASDHGANGSVALRWAAENGHLDVVQELVPVSDVGLIVRQELEVALKRPLNEEDIDGLHRLRQSLRALNALTPYVDESLLEQVVLQVPADLLKHLPHLASWHQRRLLHAATSRAPAPPRRRPSL